MVSQGSLYEFLERRGQMAKLLGALLVLFSLLVVSGVEAQTPKQWSYSTVGGTPQASYPGKVAVPLLPSAPCVNTNGSGVFGVGSCLLPGSGMSVAATRSALAALPSASNPVVWLQESGRQGSFQWSGTSHATDVTNDPNQCVYVAPASDPTGASGAYVRSYGVFFASFCGVVGDGVTDDTAAVNAAIAFDNYKGGGPISFENLTGIAVSSTITIGNGTTTSRSTINNITLQGRSPTSTFGPVASTYIKWIGSAGAGPVVKFRGPEQGGGLTGGWVVNCNSLVAAGVELDELVGGKFDNLHIRGCSGVYLNLATDATAGGLGGTRNNYFVNYSTDTVPNGGTGLLLDGSTAAGVISVLQNTFNIVDMPVSGTGATGIQLGFADFNTFNVVDIGRQSALTSTVGVKLIGKGPAGSTIFPSMNFFGALAASGGVSTDTTSGHPYGNYIALWDQADSDGLIPNAEGWIGFYQRSIGFGNHNQVMSFGFASPGYNTATPARPGGTGSANKVTNTNSYPVIIYQNGAAGTDIIDSHGGDAGALPGGTQSTIVLDPGGSVYYTTTVPTSWFWYGFH